MVKRRSRLLPQLVAGLLGLLLSGAGPWHPHAASAQILPPGFQETVVYQGFDKPTLVRFGPDGSVWVGQYDGRIFVYDDLADPTPTLFADLSTNVFSGWDRGLLGLAVHPDFPTTPYVYVLYAYDAPPGEEAPWWNDICPDPPGWTDDGCVVTGRLSRLEMGGGGVMQGPEVVLIGSVGSPPNVTGSQWCQQYPSHSTGDLAFGTDGMLYATGGDGASFNFADWGQEGGDPGSPTPSNPCADPPSNAPGGVQTQPTAEGGALRSQDLLTTGDPTSYSGTVLRIDPITGAAAPGNPLAGGSDLVDDRIVAFGLRNPFRIGVHPGSNRLYIGDVGWGTWEEVNEVEDGADAFVENFGWPCYEGGDGTHLQLGGYTGLDMCIDLYAAGGSAAPGTSAPSLYAYRHADQVVPGEDCGTGGSSVGGMAVYTGATYPALYQDALFFQDATRRCIWAMLADGNGDPDPANIVSFLSSPSGRPVDLTLGPDGDLYYADFEGGNVYKIAFFAANTPPVAVIDAQPGSGPAPLDVQFDGSGSFDDDGDALSFEWDLDGDGSFDDSTIVAPTFQYVAGGNVDVRLRVTDDGVPSESGTAGVTITVDNTPPLATILTPDPPPAFAVGDPISFSGEATDLEDGLLPASQLVWTLDQVHCSHLDPQDCHTHPVQTWNGTSGETFAAPDHGYPSHLQLTLSASDFGVNGGQGVLSDAVTLEIYPVVAPISVDSVPQGLEFSLGEATETTPDTLEVIVNSQTSLSVVSPQSLGGDTYTFESWSNGGSQSQILNPQAAELHVATFALAVCDDDGVCDLGEDCGGCPGDCASSSGGSCGDGVCNAADGEDCVSCALDCNGQQSGKRANRFCCGAGGGTNPVACSDARCSASGWLCSDVSAPPSCCGDLVCEGAEDGTFCAVDCGPPAFCGDGQCNGGETSCDCAQDCGAPQAGEVPGLTCDDGVDNDCDGLSDCSDGECASDAACSCTPRANSCTSDGQCCSGRCRGPAGSRTCK